MTAERLRARDSAFLHAEGSGQPMHTGALAVFEGAPLRDAAGELRLADVRAWVGARLELVPRLRQRLLRPLGGLLRPVWVDATDFDIADHIDVVSLGADRDEAALLELTAAIQSEPLDRDRPLWHLRFVDGLRGGQVAVVQRMHHAMVDGIAGVDANAALLDLWPADQSPLPAAPFRPHVPSRRELTRVVATGAARDVLGAAGTFGSVVRHVGRTQRLVAASGARRTSLNRPIGADRRYEVIRHSLGDVRAVSEALGGTVNDVVLAAVAGGFRRLLLERGERTDPLIVFVPVSTRAADEHHRLGNRVSGMFVRLPTDADTPAERYAAIVAETASRKLGGDAGSLADLTALAEVVPEFALRVPRSVMNRQPLLHAVVTNVPGAQLPVHLMGARLLEVFPVVPLGGNLTVSVGILSYDGQLNLGLLADPQSFGDLDVFVEGIEKSLAELGGLARHSHNHGAHRDEH